MKHVIVLAVLTAFVSVLVGVGSSSGKGATNAICTVSPDPVAMHSSYTVTISGGLPNATYLNLLEEKNVLWPYQTYGDVLPLATDSSGNGSELLSTDFNSNGVFIILQPGTVNFALDVFHQSGAPPSGSQPKCSFTVVQ